MQTILASNSARSADSGLPGARLKKCAIMPRLSSLADKRDSTMQVRRKGRQIHTDHGKDRGTMYFPNRRTCWSPLEFFRKAQDVHNVSHRENISENQNPHMNLLVV